MKRAQRRRLAKQQKMQKADNCKPAKVENSLQLAAAHYQEVRLEQAETVCRQILKSRPQLKPALRML